LLLQTNNDIVEALRQTGEAFKQTIEGLPKTRKELIRLRTNGVVAFPQTFSQSKDLIF
jgi:hypothetical protein